MSDRKIVFLLVLGLVLSCVMLIGLGFLVLSGLGALGEAVLPKLPTAVVYISSPDDPSWKTELVLPAGFRKSVILQRLPDSVRRVEVRYQIPMSGRGRLLCDQNKPSVLGETFNRREESRGDTLFQVVEVAMRGRGSASELYGANVLLNFCGIEGYYASESRWIYYLGFWYGPETRVAAAAKEVRGVTADSLRPLAR